ncbi:MAG: CHRD domain-containing protein [Betaproteobacteria bacterium]|nr:CHRD domain-containing protein [Betaproteobacteria bacterium]MBI2224027.1 CHRD domain-containing protein [Betaproteobacteria bacterium]MBI2289627.1 CHRD domain-containing protein [Betaproteobacteria bacterium]MBI3052562.1 CHRD domain-containing protein [Betaproteobacteria bacterium]
MSALKQVTRQALWAVLSTVAILLPGCSDLTLSNGNEVMLNGKQEVPPVTTSASGNGTITVGPDKSVSGSITTTGVVATAAHIHDGAPGKNGPVIIPLVKTSENVWSVPAGAKLTDAQHESYRAGSLYVNVHSAANKGGELRGQLRP